MQDNSTTSQNLGRVLSDNFSVGAQIRVEDLPKIAALGFKSIINNRPDGEDLGQPSHEEIAKAAVALGLEIYHLPLASGQAPNQALLDETKRVLMGCCKPIFAYCRSGTRSANIFAAAQGD